MNNDFDEAILAGEKSVNTKEQVIRYIKKFADVYGYFAEAKSYEKESQYTDSFGSGITIETFEHGLTYRKVKVIYIKKGNFFKGIRSKEKLLISFIMDDNFSRPQDIEITEDIASFYIEILSTVSEMKEVIQKQTEKQNAFIETIKAIGEL